MELENGEVDFWARNVDRDGGIIGGGNFPKIESLIDEWCEVLERKQGNEFGYRYPYCGAIKSHTLGKGLFAKKETYSTYTWENLL